MLKAIWNHIHEKWSLAIKVILFVVLPGILIQYFVRLQGWNVLDMDIIVASLLTGAVFLIGFMLAGTLEDFKESEKILGSIVVNILSIQDHNRVEGTTQQRKRVLRDLIGLVEAVQAWLMEKIKMEELLQKVNHLSPSIWKWDENYGSRCEQEQRDIRASIMRINVIRQTTFIQAGYSIMEVISFTVLVLIMFSSTSTYALAISTYASSSFILVYMILLIKDMDDPFEYSSDGEKSGIAEVSLLPLKTARELLKKEEKSLR